MMKLMFVFTIIVIVSSTALFAQNNNAVDTVPPYKKTDKIPYFSILQPDSTWFVKNQLPENKPVIIVYFSPDCGHCQMTAKELVAGMDELKDVEMVWVSYHTPKQIKDFADAYGLSHFNNVIMGRDPNYFFVPFYKIGFTPFMAVYDKNGKFLKAYDGGTTPDVLAQLIKNAK